MHASVRPYRLRAPLGLRVHASTRSAYALKFALAESDDKLEAAMYAGDHNVEDDGYLPDEVSYFLDNANHAKVLYEELFSFLEGEFGPIQEPQSSSEGGRGRGKLVVFHPPRA